MNIFDLITANDLAVYWIENTRDEQPYLGEQLFPNRKKIGLDLNWMLGANNTPIYLKSSAFDVEAVPRPRRGFERVMAMMPFFKESMYIDEELRQQLNILRGSNQPMLENTILTRIFDDEMQLLTSAAVSRERMRMQLLTTGIVSMANNGQSFTFDYQLDAGQFQTAATSWTDPAANIYQDLLNAKDYIYNNAGATISRGIMNQATWRLLLNNETIKQNIAVLSPLAVNFIITEEQLRQYFQTILGIEFYVYDAGYIDETGERVKYIPDNVVSLFPAGNLGNTWFGTTPEESDLMSSPIANVSIVDTGVAVTTMKSADPVNVETKISQICLPSFERGNTVVILDVA